MKHEAAQVTEQQRNHLIDQEMLDRLNRIARVNVSGDPPLIGRHDKVRATIEHQSMKAMVLGDREPLSVINVGLRPYPDPSVFGNRLGL